MFNAICNHLEKYKTFDINILNIINNYVDNIEKYEITFFNHILPNIDNNYLNTYYNIDFSLLYDEEKTHKEKIDFLNSYNLEISDLEDELCVIIRYNEKNDCEFKWLFIKSNTFENSISEITINRFKNVLKRTNKTHFSLIEIYKLSSKHCICLHCVIVEILQSNFFQETQFIKELKKITNNSS